VTVTFTFTFDEALTAGESLLLADIFGLLKQHRAAIGTANAKPPEGSTPAGGNEK
jgi:hypothetical protein